MEPVDEIFSDVRIATLNIDKLPQATFELLSMLFYEASDEPRFVSVTRVHDVITLVADAQRLEALPGLEVDPTEWAVIRQADALDEVGAIRRLTSPLADAGISVFHLSTYDAEVILVPRARLSDALGCFDRTAPAEPASSSATEVYYTHSYPLEVLEQHRTTIVRLEKQYAQWHMGALLRLLFLPRPGDPEQAVVSLTESLDGEISILAEVAPWWREHCDALPAGLSSVDQEEMVPICIRNAALNETGVVAAMASVLSENQISILGCSTLSGGELATDFTFVPLSQVEKATKAFEAAGFLITKC